MTFSRPIAFALDFRMLNAMANISSNPVRLT
jgi:hypothetical protein